MCASSSDVKADKEAAEFQKIQRIMNREFAIPHFNDQCFIRQDLSRTTAPSRRKDRNHRHSRSARNRELSLHSSNKCPSASANDAVSTRSSSPILVTEFRRSVLFSGQNADRDDNSDTTCDYTSEDAFDAENIPAPLTASYIPLRREYHRLSRSVSHPDYTLGQESHDIDMVVESTEESGKFAVSLLRQFDAAFVRRSDGRFSYAMLIDRTMSDDHFENSLLTFVLDEEGSTKSIKMSKWGKYVRLVKGPLEVNARNTRVG